MSSFAEAERLQAKSTRVLPRELPEISTGNYHLVLDPSRVSSRLVLRSLGMPPHAPGGPPWELVASGCLLPASFKQGRAAKHFRRDRGLA